MEIPLGLPLGLPTELLCEIYAWCSPKTVYAMACASYELSKIARKCFKNERYLIKRKKFQIEHRKTFKETLESLHFRYDLFDASSLRFDYENNRRIGYHWQPECLDTIEDHEWCWHILVIVSSDGPRINADWKLKYSNVIKGIQNRFEATHGEYVYAVRYHDTQTPDPVQRKFRLGRMNVAGLNHIQLY